MKQAASYLLVSIVALAQAAPMSGSSVPSLSAVPPSVTLPAEFTAQASATPSPQPNPSSNSTLQQQILQAVTAPDRMAAIYQAGPDYWRFNFLPAANPSHGVAYGRGGEGVLADRKSFPMLANLGVAMSYGWLDPCGMNPPHTHPRGTELLTIVTPTPNNPVRSGFVYENEFNMEFNVDLYQGTATVFPQGAIHYEFNDNCEPALFVAAFSSDDPGLSDIANNFFALNSSILQADLGFYSQLTAANIRAMQPYIPPAFSLGAMECLDRCNITY